MSVPPLARASNGDLDSDANGAIMAHMAAGGVTTFLYGGNALAHHWPMSRYGAWWDALVRAAPPGAWMIPSVGPDGGKLLDQAEVLGLRDVPVALLLPMAPPYTADGMDAALRLFHRTSGTQLVIYVKSDGYIAPTALAKWVEDGVVLGVKYAVPRAPGAEDPYLASLIAAIGADRILSGFGEPPAIPHLLDHGLAGFTAGCVCIAPALSMGILHALQSDNRARAMALVTPLLPLERLRNDINEIRVLHEAVAAAGIAPTGPVLSPSSEVPANRKSDIKEAAKALLDAEMQFREDQAA